MGKTIDLHIHSNFSEDADLSVEEIFKSACNLPLSAISITDHDSIESLEVARSISPKYDIEYVPGVEITSVLPVDGSQQHILGYFIDEKNNDLINALDRIKKSRILITNKRIEMLQNLGFAMNEERIWDMTGGRSPTATSIMVEIFDNEKNFNDARLYEYFYGDKKDDKLGSFYREYLIEGKPAYVPFQTIDIKEAVEIIKKADGIPVLAHPKFVKKREWLDQIRGYGIEGIEAISTYHTPEDRKFYLEYAMKNSLLITSGSDFHGPTAKPKVKLGGISGNDYSLLQKIKDFYVSIMNTSYQPMPDR